MSRLIKLPLLHHNISIYNINGVIYATNPLKNNNKLAIRNMWLKRQGGLM